MQFQTKALRNRPVFHLDIFNLTFSFPEGFTADDKQRTILERAANTCPVMYSIHPDIEVNVKFEWPVVARREA